MLRLHIIEFDETTELPLPLTEETKRILVVEMLEHEGLEPCYIPGRGMCMKIKVLREMHVSPESFNL